MTTFTCERCEDDLADAERSTCIDAATCWDCHDATACQPCRDDAKRTGWDK